MGTVERLRTVRPQETRQQGIVVAGALVGIMVLFIVLGFWALSRHKNPDDTGIPTGHSFSEILNQFQDPRSWR